jgi:acyl-CoA synthetase (AMP-forming)/AMP-acid ligase II
MDDVASPHFSGLTISLDHCLPELIDHVARTYGEKPFVVGEDGRTTSFAGFRQRVSRLARALVAHGVAHGDRVAIWAPNSPEWMIAASAIENIGAIMVPVNTRFKGGEALYALGKTRARILFTVRSFLGNDYSAMLVQAGEGAGAARPVAALPDLGTIVLLDDSSLAAFESAQCDEATLDARIASVGPDSIADILFTSGTTGYPKGAMHNHGQALWMVANWNRSNDLRAGDRAIVVNPFFHSFGYRSGWVSALAAGMTVFPIASFDPEAVLRTIERERISVLMGPPTIFTTLMGHPNFKSYDISSLRVGHTGAANVPVDLIRAGREIFGFDLFLTSFGQTETTALVTVNYPGSDFETIARTVGVPLPGVEVRIAEESGELLVRGPNVMQGYFEDPEQTAATIDAEGWLHTGDVACVNPDGTVRILDRLKDVVIVGGFNAYPAEIETILRAHPAIADVCVIGWPDDRMGEVCAACVILRPGTALTLADLSAWSRERMANYKVPRHLFLVDDFPRTPLGKIQKFVLRERLKLLVEGGPWRDSAAVAGEKDGDKC